MYTLDFVKNELAKGIDKDELLESVIKNKKIRNLSQNAFLLEKFASIEYLLESGADPNTQIYGSLSNDNDRKLNVLEHYIKHDYASNPTNEVHLRIIKLFLAHGTKPTIDCLITCANCGLNDGIKLLFEAGMDINELDSRALSCAVFQNQLETVKLLVDLGSNVNSKKFHPLENLAKSETDDAFEIAKFLISRGSISNTNDSYSLLMAVQSNIGLKTIELLVNDGADINAQNGNIISYAITSNIIYGEKPTVGRAGDIMINHIVMGQLSVLKFFIEKGADLKKFELLINFCCRQCHNEKIFDLLHNCGFNFFNKYTYSLHDVVVFRNIVFAKKLLELGADPNLNNGVALNRAVSNSNIEMVELLLKFEANVKFLDETTFKKYLSSGLDAVPNILIMLIHAGYNLPNLESAELKAITNPAMIEILINNGVDPDKFETKN